MCCSRWVLVLAAAIAAAGAPPVAAAAVPCLLDRPGFARDRCDVRACLACHDGGAGAAVHCEHPVDVVYATSWLARRASLRASIPPELPLTAGRVTCATCHDTASTVPRHLAVVPGPYGLCGACHAK